MHLNLSSDLEKKLKSLPNPDEFAELVLQQAFGDETDRPLTDFERKFVLESLEEAKRGETYSEEEMKEFFRSKGVDC